MTSRIEYILFGLYVLLGPVASVALAIALVKGRKRMRLLQRTRSALPATLPRVSIIVPAKDEAQQITDCLRSILAQDYPHFEVVAIDDRSTDGTGQIMDALAKADSRLNVVHIAGDGPPPRWTGKCFALHTAMDHARGDWLLFADSDVVLQPNALSVTLAFASRQDVGLLSLITRQTCRSFWEALLEPLAGCALSMMHMVALTNNDHHRRISFANGQYMLFRRSVYEAIGGHRAVRERFCEDIAFARLAKANGHRVRLCSGEEFASVRMYASLAAIVRGWARIFFAADVGKVWRMLLAIGYLVLGCCSAYVAVTWGLYRICEASRPYAGYGWMIAGTIHVTLLTVLLAKLYRWTGNKWQYALVFPLAFGALMGIFAQSIRMCLTGNVQWRGTQYSGMHQREPAPE